MSNFTADIRLVAQLANGLDDCGFTDESIEKLIRKIPDRRFSDPKKGILRKLYLAHIGLAEFVLKPGIINLDVNKPIWHGHHVQPEDTCLYNSEFDLTQLRLIQIKPNGPRPFLFKKAMALYSSSHSEHTFGNVWHLQWLVLHPEFIPERWKIEMHEKKSKIIFPGVRLLDDRGNGPHYPYLFYHGTLDYSYQMWPEWDLYPERMFFVSVGKK